MRNISSDFYSEQLYDSQLLYTETIWDLWIQIYTPEFIHIQELALKFRNMAGLTDKNTGKDF